MMALFGPIQAVAHCGPMPFDVVEVKPELVEGLPAGWG